MNEPIIQEIYDYLKNQLNGKADTSDVKQYLVQLHNGLDDEFMDCCIAEGEKKDLFHRSNMSINGRINDTVSLIGNPEPITPNYNKTSVEDLMEKYKKPVKLPCDNK